MANRVCQNCSNTEVVLLATAHRGDFEDTRPGEPVGYVYCPDCHTETPWNLDEDQLHLVCSNRANRKAQGET